MDSILDLSPVRHPSSDYGRADLSESGAAERKPYDIDEKTGTLPYNPLPTGKGLFEDIGTYLKPPTDRSSN